LTIARLTDELAARYGQPPSAILREDARTILRMRAILAEAADPEES